MSDTPKLSIITVTYNAERFLEKTIQSIEEQTFKNKEYIIVDGLSKDNTTGIIRSYPHVVSSWISEKDQGLYDAMNKAIRMAKGEYLMFLNAGDLLFDKSTLSRIFDNFRKEDLIYGDTSIIDQHYQTVGMRHLRPPEELHWKSFRNGMVICHQAILARRSIVPFYDTRYKVAADIDWAIRLTQNAESCFFYRETVVKFMQDGISTQYRMQGLKERFRVMVRYYGFLPTLFSNLGLGLKYFLRLRFLSNVRK
jgi:glycosyltransferase involved in cell wall biosynthesis